jgi:hypothetical protein
MPGSHHQPHGVTELHFGLTQKERQIMKKKSMLLATAALTALVLAALPAVAAAGEYEAHCEGAATCGGTITGGQLELEYGTGEKAKCLASVGNVSLPTTSSTGTASVTLTNCREQVTAFQFPCTSPGTPSGQIAMNNLTFHFVNLEHGGTKPAIAFTGFNLTYGCNGNKTTTGSLIGLLEAPEAFCNIAVSTHGIELSRSESGIGNQTYKQITTTGASLDLIANNDTVNGAYFTTALVATWTIHWDHQIKVTC